MSKLQITRLDNEIPEEFDNLTDRTAQYMVAEHLWTSYKIIKAAQPDICGFKATLVDDGENSRVELDIMRRED